MKGARKVIELSGEHQVNLTPKEKPKCRAKVKLFKQLKAHHLSIPIDNIKRLFIASSIVTVTIYIIMIEGLGKGVKYSLFVANAIIFVSCDCFALVGSFCVSKINLN